MSLPCISDLITTSSKKLNDISDSAVLDTEILLLAALNSQQSERTYNRAFLRSWPDYELSLEQDSCFQTYLQQRIKGKPVAYILGTKEFWSLNFIVNQHTLIPRPDTELLVESALELIPQECPYHILDLGTGSGAIALSLASERPKSQVFAVDKSFQALEVCKKNKQQMAINNCHFFCGSWLAPLKQNIFDFIISNPPYIRPLDPHLQQLEYEPISALVAEENGLKDCRIIIQQAKHYLNTSGYLLIEHGYDQSSSIESLFEQENYQDIKQIKDLSGVIRITMGKNN